MSALWTAAEIVAATGGAGPVGWSASGVSIDSRTVTAGDLFVALAGPSFDGHDFVADALKRGAAGALVSRKPEGLSADAPLILVPDTLAALTELGRAGRARSRARVIAVTGSVGKTGSKEALRRSLERQGKTVASVASLNNHWGVPLSLARMPADTAYGVFEIGMNHPGEIAALTRLARPDIALITTISPAHLGFFSSVEAIADAKAEIFQGMPRDGVAVLNRDNPQFERLSAAARACGVTHALGFGGHADASVRLIDCHLYSTASAVSAMVVDEIVDYCVSLPGRHWVINSLAVMAAVKAAGADISIAAAAMGSLEALDGRGRRHRIAVAGGEADLVDESYNANPDSMRAALAVLGAIQPRTGGRRIAVLGDMLELGDAASQLHAELAQPLLAAGVDVVFTVGREMENLDRALPAARRGGHAATSAELVPALAAALRSGDVVMIKGSLGSRMAEIVKPLLKGVREAALAAKG
ncbi:MAG TPA: UDP-N-acetylmuramoylalanyl-D-glutamyl-2,6-diaminopimelate--D-alanyl-D-alanine ligase [Stellaceae bacterium]|nr:UDP-N-acetylmuramoylalanyl-D-glutamyl-2,6-diaminopimelate--D-alanyl-D-alanine ligase [Stellaceae bacterium]